MEIKIDAEELKKIPLMVGTPAYGGLVSSAYHLAMIDLQTHFNQMDIPIKHCVIENESLITRGRNNIVKMFMEDKSFERLLFVDADIRFNPKDVLCLLALSQEYEVICGSYPKKAINWKHVKKAIKMGVPSNKLHTFTDNPVLNFVPPESGTRTQVDLTKPIEVLDTGTGFMMISRSVFEKMEKAYPELCYTPDYQLSNPTFDKNVDTGVYSFFDTGIVIDETSAAKKNTGVKRYLSEDYMFCKRWRDIGGKIWVCPWINLIHHGTYQYHGNIRDILVMQNEFEQQTKEHHAVAEPRAKTTNSPVMPDDE